MVGIQSSLLGAGGPPKIFREIKKGILYSLPGETGPRLNEAKVEIYY